MIARVLCAALYLIPLSLRAQHVAWFRNEEARNRSLADFMDHAMRVELGHGPGYEKSLPNKFGRRYGDPRWYVIVDAGNENPIVAYTNCNFDDIPNPRLPYDKCSRRGPRAWSLQASVPVTFHLLWDAFNGTNPIVNTDYTFGLHLSYRRSLNVNDELRTALYAGHISTHIGDEYTISARGQGFFPRINVSYFPIKYDVGVRHYFPLAPNAQHSFRSWVQAFVKTQWPSWRFKADSQYYSTDPTELNGVAIGPTNARFEGFVAIDGMFYSKNGTGVDANLGKDPGAYLFGAWFGIQKVFPYLESRGRRDMLPALNVAAGYELPTHLVHSIHTDFYGRVYVGPNPYGQLRSQRNFYLTNIGMRLTP